MLKILPRENTMEVFLMVNHLLKILRKTARTVTKKEILRLYKIP